MNYGCGSNNTKPEWLYILSCICVLLFRLGGAVKIEGETNSALKMKTISAVKLIMLT